MDNINFEKDEVISNKHPGQVQVIFVDKGQWQGQNIDVKIKDNNDGLLPAQFRKDSKKIKEESNKEVLSEKNVPERRKCWQRFLGMALMTVGSVFFSLSITIAKVFQNYQVFNVCLWRFFGGCFLPSIPLLIYFQFIQKSQPFQSIHPLCQMEKFKMFGFLIARAFTGSASVILHYNALRFLSISDATVVTFSTPVFVTFLACVLLGETFGVMNILAALITLGGVVIITRPPFLTGELEMDTDVMIGVGLSLGSMTFATFVFLTLRLLKDVNFAVVTLGFGFVGTVVCLILSQVFGSFEVPRTPWDWFLAFLLSFLTFAGQVLTTVAFRYEDAGPLSLCRSFDVIFSFLWQAIFLSVLPDKYSVIGSLVVLSGVIIIGFRKHISSLPKEHTCRKMCCCVLK